MPTAATLPPIASGIGEIAWPVVPDRHAAEQLALQSELDRTQWWDADTLARHQFLQLDGLLRHARRTVPFYRERLAAFDGAAAATLASLPILTRSQVQEHYRELCSSDIPPQHGQLVRYASSGSTGRPVQVLGTALHGRWWRALMLRDHLWHRRRFDQVLAVLKTRIRDRVSDNWGRPTHGVFDTGSCVSINSDRDLPEQYRLVREAAPAYLLSHATNLRALARYCIAERLSLPGLSQVRSFGEMLPPDLRELCREAWNVPLVDAYSAAEIGVIALQCPQTGYYHVQSEHVIVEVLDETGRPCSPGATGRVVVTPLHNFAMPLLRYDLSDFAVVGEACVCGRGLPVLQSIRGRRRNMLRLPDGSTHWPSIPAKVWGDESPIRQFQLVQRERDRIEVRLVASRRLTAAEQTALETRLSERLRWHFDYDFDYCDVIDDGPGFEDFVCLIDDEG